MFYYHSTAISLIELIGRVIEFLDTGAIPEILDIWS